MLLDKIFKKRRNIFLSTQGKSKFSVSVGHALDGIEYAIDHERNVKIEILFGIMVSIAGVFFHITVMEWLVILLTIAMVITLEFVNTAIERVVDLVTVDYKELAKSAKDVAAGAVLFMSLFSVIIGIVIFLPRILELFN